MLVSPGMSQLTSNSDTKTPTTNIVMVPAEYVKKYKPQLLNVSIIPSNIGNRQYISNVCIIMLCIFFVDI